MNEVNSSNGTSISVINLVFKAGLLVPLLLWTAGSNFIILLSILYSHRLRTMSNLLVCSLNTGLLEILVARCGSHQMFCCALLPYGIYARLQSIVTHPSLCLFVI
ncbi:Alpha-2C adrenergic receptor [Trichinella pseudospiralis]